ncbi:TetR family transcriptional regulator [Ruicaihuangia caeni]|uniref:TetR/AcrR family transcriptional regulator n=1 Tax=Ruicaihuangia caeni TaxID=3042517 RepID=A0AAW6T6I7_9MICO|nr:TetR/AcrR family transcriptional regulator [Klugiella sp. YN-L-19]MDI2098686.1 TetR/AcrR family transcriptional regulator [Klugiella sp. YN-L-19]
MESTPSNADASAGHTRARAAGSRAARQQETREALVMAALDAFTRVGYHAASLDTIAAEAGFSKGAVYSNFTNKAQLFLATMDFTMGALRSQGWDPFAAGSGSAPGRVSDHREPHDEHEADAESPATSAPGSLGMGGADTNPEELVRGFGLATLEFIAAAARDEALTEALRERVQVMIDVYADLARANRPADDSLPAEDAAKLMAALDQGVSVLSLSGITSIDGGLVRVGLQRLLDPGAAASAPAPERDRSSPLLDVDRVRTMMENESPDA